MTPLHQHAGQWLITLLLALACSAALAQDPDFPQLTGRVVDNAGMISPATEKNIIARLQSHEQATGEQVVVVTLPDLQGYSIEEFGYRLGRHWGIGEKDEDTGALLIVAKKERAIRIEVGYGLEGRLTDARSRQIISGIISPAFKQGNFDAGIGRGVDAMLTVLGGGDVAPPAARNKKDEPSALGTILMALVILMMLGGGRGLIGGLFLGSMLGGRGSGGFGGGGFGGGGFSGGGGGFGGGGASGGW